MTRKCSATSCQMRFWRLRGANVGRGPRVPLRLDFAQGQIPAPGGRRNTGPNNFARRIPASIAKLPELLRKDGRFPPLLVCRGIGRLLYRARPWRTGARVCWRQKHGALKPATVPLAPLRGRSMSTGLKCRATDEVIVDSFVFDEPHLMKFRGVRLLA
jgi:hypothetical protein